MNLKAFPIEVNYDDAIYFGSVRRFMQGEEIKYAVNLETEDPLTRFSLVLRPCPSRTEDWESIEENGQWVTDKYERRFLNGIGNRAKAAH